MKILITGSKGFVGKNLTENLKNIRDGKNRTRPALTISEIFEYPQGLPEPNWKVRRDRYYDFFLKPLIIRTQIPFLKSSSMMWIRKPYCWISIAASVILYLVPVIGKYTVVISHILRPKPLFFCH